MQSANHLIEAICKEDERLRYVDLATILLGDDGRPRKDLFLGDGLHLNEKGYKIWSAILRPMLEESTLSQNRKAG